MAAPRATVCLVCGGETRETLPSAYDDRYGFPGTFCVRRCQECGHARLDAAFSAGQLGELYSRYYPRSTFSLADYKPRAAVTGFRAWLDGERRHAYTWVPPGVSVLDVGCGFGESLGYHRARGCVARGVELDENARRVAEAFGLDIDIGPFDPARYEASTFDYVTLDQVVEHVDDPLETLCGVARVLRPGGVVIVSTPNLGGWGRRLFGRRWIHWHIPYHQQFFTRRSVRLVAGEAGFDVVEARTITCSDWLHWQLIHLVTFPKPGEPSSFWTRRGGVRGLRRFGLAAFQALWLAKILHAVTRVIDALGAGDNLLVVLRKR